jgi:hypothetical protein
MTSRPGGYMLWESPSSASSRAAGVEPPLRLTELESLSNSVVSLAGEVGVAIMARSKASG